MGEGAAWMEQKGFEVWDDLQTTTTTKKNPTYTQQKEVLWSKNKHVFISAASEIQNKGNAFPCLSRGVRGQGTGPNEFYQNCHGQVALLAFASHVTQ